MQSKWKKEHRRILLTIALLLGLWSFLIYWQGDISWNAFTSSISALLRSDFSSIPSPFDSIFIDLAIIILGASISFLFFAHFVVPLRSKDQLIPAMKIMGTSLMGIKPEALRLINGSGRNSPKGQNSKSTSVMLLDIASAALLRDKSSFTRAIGPGIHFPDKSEKMAGQLDLRIQRRSSGPFPSEDPFAPRSKDENEAEFLAREKRRGESTALTKDGVEIVPRLEVLFRVEGRANAGMPFPFQAEFAWRAIANEGVSPNNPSDVRNRQVGWDWLPAQLASDLWRVFLRKYSLSKIFEEISENGNQSKGMPKLSGLQQIETQINQRLKNALIAGKDGRKSSPEYQLLRKRGIQILSIMIREVHVDPSREESRLVNEWSENWELHALQKNISNTEIREQEKALDIGAAASEFVKMASQDLLQRLRLTDGEKVLPPNQEESLNLLLEGSLRNASKLPDLDPEIIKGLQALKDFAASRERDAR